MNGGSSSSSTNGGGSGDLPFRLSFIAGWLIVANGVWEAIQLAYIYEIPFWIFEYARISSLFGFGSIVIIGAMKLKEYGSDKLLWIALIIAFSIAGTGSYVGTAGTILGVIGGVLALRPMLRE
ncbi:MAG: hypothetical protein RMJ59_02450 [Candidatus Nitrosocaldus sp.]|nr:hypothetical protein [Candidatus Nitrosocaldus sp.]